MARQILVALNSEDRLSQMIPYIEEIAQSGMRIVFLIGFRPQAATRTPRYNSLGLRCSEEPRSEWKLEKSRFVAENNSGMQSMEEQRLAVEHKVFLALEAWIKRGVEITVDVYMSSLRRAVKSYTRKGNVDLIVMRARRKRTVMEFVEKAFPVFGLFKHPTFAPVRVLHPTQAV